jgi:hypothetical protein
MESWQRLPMIGSRLMAFGCEAVVRGQPLSSARPVLYICGSICRTDGRLNLKIATGPELFAAAHT